MLAAACGGSTPTGPTPPPPTPVAEPAITCPANVAATTASTTAVVTFSAPVTTGGTPPATFTCTATSGASFPIGTTNVSCTYTDAIARSAVCSFNVTVVLKVFVKYTKYWAFGDSLTEGEVSTSSASVFGFGPRAIDKANNYPTVLDGLLKERYTSQVPVVINLGRAGETAANDADRLRETLTIGPVPEVLLLMEGSNEMTSGEDGQIAQIIPSLEADIRVARARGVKEIMLATFPPARSGRLGTYVLRNLTTVNQQIRNLASQQGVFLVDLYAAMAGQENSLVGDDGLHLTVAGYRKMAETFMTSIRTAFESGTAPSNTFLSQRR